MDSSIAFCFGKKEYCVGTEETDSVPVFLFIRSIYGSIKFFNEFFRFGKVNVKPLTTNPLSNDYLSGKHQSRSLSEIVSVLVESNL